MQKALGRVSVVQLHNYSAIPAVGRTLLQIDADAMAALSVSAFGVETLEDIESFVRASINAAYERGFADAERAVLADQILSRAASR